MTTKKTEYLLFDACKWNNKLERGRFTVKVFLQGGEEIGAEIHEHTTDGYRTITSCKHFDTVDEAEIYINSKA